MRDSDAIFDTSWRANRTSVGVAWDYTLIVPTGLCFCKLAFCPLQVTAIGSPDVALSWVFDLQLGMARLFGLLCSSALDCRKCKPSLPAVSSHLVRPLSCETGTIAWKSSEKGNSCWVKYFWWRAKSRSPCDTAPLHPLFLSPPSSFLPPLFSPFSPPPPPPPPLSSPPPWYILPTSFHHSPQLSIFFPSLPVWLVWLGLPACYQV